MALVNACRDGQTRSGAVAATSSGSTIPTAASAPMPATARVALTVPIAPPRTLGPSAGPADYLEVDAEAPVESQGPRYEFRRVAVDGAQMAYSFVLLGERHPQNLPFEDLWVSSDGTHAHFRLIPKEGLATEGTPGMVRVAFGNDRGEIEASARFTTGPNRTLMLSTGQSTSPSSFYSGPVRSEELVVANAGAVTLGLISWDAGQRPEGARSKWRILVFDTWLNESLPAGEQVVGAPRVEVEGGRTYVSGWSADMRHGRLARVEYDPRDKNQRLRIGRHKLTVTWTTRAGQNSRSHSLEGLIGVGDDGTIELLKASH